MSIEQVSGLQVLDIDLGVCSHRGRSGIASADCPSCSTRGGDGRADPVVPACRSFGRLAEPVPDG